jgi:hypothetical protein
MTHFKFQKSLLAVSATAVMAGMLVNVQAQAQAVNNRGQVNYISQISAATCVLDLGDTASTTAGSKTINFGSFTTANVSAVAAGGTISVAAPFTISLKAPGGTGACALGSTKWDISVDVPPTQWSTTFKPGFGVLTNQAAAAIAATNVAVLLNVTPTGLAKTTIDFSFKPSAYNTTLLSGCLVACMGAADTFLMEFLLVKGTGAVTSGSYKASLPLLVY